MKDTFPEAYVKQQTRLAELIKQYEYIGPAGAFGKMAIAHTLKLSQIAAAEGNLAEMVRVYKQMEECE